jgi:hypothetical protein
MWDGGRMTDNVDKGGYSKPYKKSSYKETAATPSVTEEVILDNVEPVLPPVPVLEPVVVAEQPPVMTGNVIDDAQRDAAIVAELIAESRAIVAARKSVNVEPSNEAIVNELIEESRAVIKARSAVKDGVSDEKIIAAGVARKTALQKKLDSLYTIGAWEDLKNYECKVCPYSTLDIEMVRSHVRKHI